MIKSKQLASGWALIISAAVAGPPCAADVQPPPAATATVTLNATCDSGWVPRLLFGLKVPALPDDAETARIANQGVQLLRVPLNYNDLTGVDKAGGLLRTCFDRLTPYGILPLIAVQPPKPATTDVLSGAAAAARVAAISHYFAALTPEPELAMFELPASVLWRSDWPPPAAVTSTATAPAAADVGRLFFRPMANGIGSDGAALLAALSSTPATTGTVRVLTQVPPAPAAGGAAADEDNRPALLVDYGAVPDDSSPVELLRWLRYFVDCRAQAAVYAPAADTDEGRRPFTLFSELLAEWGRFSEVSVSCAAPASMIGIGCRYAGGVSLGTANTSSQPVPVRASVRLPAGVYSVQVKVLSPHSEVTGNEWEKAPLVVRASQDVNEVRFTLPPHAAAVVRFNNDLWMAYKLLGEVASQVQSAIADGSHRRSLLKPLAEARNVTLQRLQAPVDPDRTAAAALAALLRCAQAESLLKNERANGSSGLSLDATIGVLANATDRLSAASCAGLGVTFQAVRDEESLADWNRSRTVTVSVSNGGRKTLTRVLLSLTGPAGTGITYIGGGGGSQVPPGGGQVRRYRITPSADTAGSSNVVTARLSYYVARSYARRSRDIEIAAP